MKDLFTGIYSLFIETSSGNHNALYTALGGRLFNGRALQGTTFPYGVFFLAAGEADWDFSNKYENSIVQFSLFTNESSSSNLETYFGYLCDLYDGCSLTFTNDTLVFMNKKSYRLTAPSDDNNIWQCDVDFDVMVKKK